MNYVKINSKDYVSIKDITIYDLEWRIIYEKKIVIVIMTI